MMKDLEIAFTAKEITAFGGVSLLYKMLDRCHFKEALCSIGLPQQGSNRGRSPKQLIYGLFTGVWCGASCYNPKRPGRKSHHPLLAFVADLRMVANYWLRPGNTSASTKLSGISGQHTGAASR